MKQDMKKTGIAELKLGDKILSLDVYEGELNERCIDISKLRQDTGYITYDPGFGNTGCVSSNITFVDGEKGVLLHRGYRIEDLAANCTFVEVAYLLVFGVLPTAEQREEFSVSLNSNSMLHEDMLHFFSNYPEHAHPMAVLSAMVVSLSTFYPEIEDENESIHLTVTRLLSKLRTIAAFSYKKSIGEPVVHPSWKYRYCENFLNMMFSSPVNNYNIDPVIERVLNLFLVLHADHEQNCSTTVARAVGSSGANLYASIAAGVCALWGPLHGGANQAVIEMLETIHAGGLQPSDVIEAAKRKNSKMRLMGFGHRVYKTYDPRAKLAKAACVDLLNHLEMDSDPLLDIAMGLEELALKDDYFIEKHLYPNVDFYTGIAYRAMGIPKNMFTVMFAMGRLPGWIAHWLEMKRDTEQKIVRPRQIYIGENIVPFIPIKER